MGRNDVLDDSVPAELPGNLDPDVYLKMDDIGNFENIPKPVLPEDPHAPGLHILLP